MSADGRPEVWVDRDQSVGDLLSVIGSELAEYRDASETLKQWGDEPGPAHLVIADENRLTEAACRLAEAVSAALPEEE